MALRATPTIAICLAAAIASGLALARPGDRPDSPPSAEAAEEQSSDALHDPVGNPDSPYLVDGSEPDAATASPQSTPIRISIEGFEFSAVGDIGANSGIEVTNLDGADHTLTARDGSFDTGTLGQGQQAAVTAPGAPGAYEFFCTIHPSMIGQLVVA